jgi:hypothetical protein
VFAPLPIPRPAPPTELTWHPTYPDWLQRKPGVRAAQVRLGTSFIGVPFLDLRWRSSYPDRLDRRQLPSADQRFFSGPDFGFLVVPMTGGWRSLYPSRLTRLLPVPTGARVWVVDPTTLINAAHCLEWTAEALTTPLLTAEAAVSPSFTEEALTYPQLIEEDLC